MPNSDSEEFGTLRSGKRFGLGGKKRNSDGESITYTERHPASESEYHCNEKEWINWSEWFRTPEQVKAPRTRYETATESESSISIETQRGNIVNLAISSETTMNQPMAGCKMRLPLFHGTGSEDPQQHWFLCDALSRVKKVTDFDMKANQMVTTFRDRALNWYMNIF